VFAYKLELDRWLEDKRTAVLPRRLSAGVRGFVLPAAAGALVLAAGFLLKTAGIIVPTPHISVLAVRSNVSSGSTEQDFFLAEGFRAEVQRRLGASGRFQVTRLPSAALVKAVEAGEAGPAVLPDYVLEGSLVSSGGRPALVVALRKRRNNKVLWSGSYENPAERLTSCTRDVCENVFAALGVKPSKRAAEAPDLLGPGSYEPYLTGQLLLDRIAGEAEDPATQAGKAAYLSLLDDEGANKQAFKLFNQVLGGNPRFAPALVGLAQCYINDVNLGIDQDLRWLDKAADKIAQAEAIDPGAPNYDRLRIQILLIRDVLGGGDSLGSYFEIARRALDAFPRDPGLNSIVGYCWFLEFGRSGRDQDFEKALQFKKRAFWGDPASSGNICLAEFLMLNGDFEEALRVCSLIQPGPNAYWLDSRRAEIYFYMRELDRSEAILRAQTDPRADLTARYLRGMIAAARGDGTVARRILDEIDRLHPPKGSPFADAVWYASILAGIGETSAAEEALRIFSGDPKAQAMRHINQLYVDINPNLRALRTQMIVAKKGR
jgi:TolB-like protein/tetratricopeptide (TPR) repeat protein